MNIGILGAGDIANRVAPALVGLKGEVVCYGIASRDLSKAEAFQTKWGFVKAYGSYEEMLADPEIDLVYIATPHALHYEHAKMCILAGKASLVEKPFMINAGQAEEILHLAEKHRVFISEAMWTRYMPSAGILKDAVSSGIIGDVKMLRADMSYPMLGKDRLSDPKLGGGALLDVGCYALHFASAVFGSQIEAVRTSCTFTKNDVDGNDSVTLLYPDGKMAVLTSSMLVHSPRFATISGDKGYILAGPIGNISSIKAYDGRGDLLKEYEIPKQINGYEYEFLACKAALKAGKRECEELPHTEILKMMKWMDEIRSSWGLHFPVEDVHKTA